MRVVLFSGAALLALVGCGEGAEEMATATEGGPAAPVAEGSSAPDLTHVPEDAPAPVVAPSTDVTPPIGGVGEPPATASEAPAPDPVIPESVPTSMMEPALPVEPSAVTEPVPTTIEVDEPASETPEPEMTMGGTGALGIGGAESDPPEQAGGGSDPGTEPLSFARDIWPVYERIRDPVFVYPGASSYESCVVAGVCHGGESPGAGLRMPDATTAYDDLVGVDSRSSLCDGTVRVVPGDPEASCLVLFYRGRLMDELEWVDQAEIDLMSAWILDGALP
jgi:hypothetical protein